MCEQYYTARELSVIWGVSVRMISIYCSNGLIPGAEKIGHMWIIPRSSKKPIDHRYKDINPSRSEEIEKC
jgi:hypothetical protein